MSKIVEIEKQNAKVTYTGPGWTGLAGGYELDDQTITTMSNGYGTIDKPLANQSGSSAVNLQPGTHFEYDKRLDASTTEDPTDGFGATAGGIIDTGASGAMTKKIRLVENTANVKSGTNYTALKVYAKNLASLSSPSGDRCYIDPMNGKFVLPRPAFWSKFENANSEIGSYSVYLPSGYDTGFLPSWGGSLGTVYAKWNNGLYFSSANNSEGGEIVITPSINNLTAGTMSFWYATGGIDGGAYGWSNTIVIWLGPNTYIRLYHHYSSGIANSIVINGSTATTDAGTSMMSLTPKHYYITWNNTTGIKIWVNGSLVMTGLGTWSTSTSYPLVKLYIDTTSGIRLSSIIDNLKIWNHSIVDDPTWVYNGGTGREDALHYIYGATNAYKPTGVKASYFYIASSTTPAILAKGSAPGSYVSWKTLTEY